MEEDGALTVPEQVIPVPMSVSPQARAVMAFAAKRSAAQAAGTVPRPSIDDQAAMAVQMLSPAAERFVGDFDTITLPSGASLYRVAPAGRSGRKAEVALYDIHGGGFVSGGGEMCRMLAKIRAADYGVTVYAVDYRLAPAHPFPAALDDCMAAYRMVLAEVGAANLAIAGSSAGGNLAAAVTLRARDEGLPLAAAMVLMTPGLDMTQAGDSYRTNRYLDAMLGGGNAEGPLDAYVAGHDPTDPYLSPLFGDFAKGWPPTILTTGTRDLLLSDTVQMHRALRRAGVRAELHVTEAGSHGGFMGQAPEDHEVLGEVHAFLYAAWKI